MAKPAKQQDVQITDKIATKFVKDVLAHFEQIESARGVYMARARREREAITVIHEDLASKGVSQKSSRTNIKIIRALAKIQTWIHELEAEDRKMAERLAKAQKDKKQLQLFGELPKTAKPKKADNVVQLQINDEQEVVAAE
jgi:hypothetical protein